MKKEVIEKEIRSILDEPDNEWDCIFNSGFSRGFIAATEWRINSVWHEVSEMPEKKFALVEYACFPKGNGYLVVPDAREVIESITRWAYIEDLIPNMEGKL